MPDPSEDGGWLPLQWQPKLNPRVSFDLKKFARLLATSGQRVLWQVAMRCPCGGAYGMQAAGVTCPRCKGTGWIIPVKEQLVRAVVVGYRRDVLPYDRMGPFEPGTVVMTVRAEHTPAFGDRMILIDAFQRFSEPTTRQEGPTQALRYRIATIEVPLQGGVLLDQSVISLFKETPDGPVELKLGEDFGVTMDGQLSWRLGDANGTAPRVGERFSIYYNGRPAFRVMSFPHSIRQTRVKSKAPEDREQNLPVNFVCKLEHLAFENLV